MLERDQVLEYYKALRWKHIRGTFYNSIVYLELRTALLLATVQLQTTKAPFLVENGGTT